MSHFTVLVIGMNVEEQLAPYDENLEVPEYSRECSCGKWLREDKVDDLLKSEGLNLGDLRGAFHAIPETERPDWAAHIAPYVRRQGELRNSIPLEVDADCRECKGSGTYPSTFNPQSMWDWYTPGGRWSGFFKLKPGAKGELGRPGVFDNIPAPGTADVVRAGDLADPPEPTFAVVKDGKWHERGRMGWWGAVSDEKDQGEWVAEFKALIADLPPETVLTLVDCHI